MECHRTTGRVVLPVFYDVDPSEVRHQTGESGKAFQKVLNRLLKVFEFMAPKWRDALRDAADLAGFVVLNSRLFTSSILCFYSLSYPIDHLFIFSFVVFFLFLLSI